MYRYRPLVQLSTRTRYSNNARFQSAVSFQSASPCRRRVSQQFPQTDRANRAAFLPSCHALPSPSTVIKLRVISVAAALRSRTPRTRCTHLLPQTPSSFHAKHPSSGCHANHPQVTQTTTTRTARNTGNEHLTAAAINLRQVCELVTFTTARWRRPSGSEYTGTHVALPQHFLRIFFHGATLKILCNMGAGESHRQVHT